MVVAVGGAVAAQAVRAAIRINRDMLDSCRNMVGSPFNCSSPRRLRLITGLRPAWYSLPPHSSNPDPITIIKELARDFNPVFFVIAKQKSFAVGDETLLPNIRDQVLD